LHSPASMPGLATRMLAVLVATFGWIGWSQAVGLSDGGDETPPSTAISANVGLGSAVGTLGVALARTAGDYAQVEFGAGLGGSGLQLSIMPKLALGTRRNHFLCGIGVSLAVPTHSAEATGHPIWLNVDALGAEHLSKNGIAFLVALGFTKGLGNGTACGDVLPCDDPGQLEDVTRIVLPQLRFGLGYAF
jgi:hypothetical protein